MRREQQLPRPGVRRLRDRAACKQFLEVEFHGTGDGDGRGHADHDAGTDDQGAIDGELEGEEGVGAAVGDAVGAAVEGAHVVGGGGRGDGLCCGGSGRDWCWGGEGHVSELFVEGWGLRWGGVAGVAELLLVLLWLEGLLLVMLWWW